MKISVYRSPGELPIGVKARWRYPAEPDFQSSLDWFTTLAGSGVSEEIEPRLYVLKTKDESVAAALACCRQRGQRTLRSLTSFYSTEFEVHCPATDIEPERFAESFAAYVASERPAWDAIDLRYFRSTSRFKDALAKALRRHGFSVHEFFQYENWYEPIRGEDYKSYFAARPSQMRNTVTRREKKLRREHQYEVRIGREAGELLDSLVNDFIVVYSGSWKRPEPFPDFIPALARSAAARGVLRLGVLYVDQTPAAAQLWLVAHERATIYKLAYDERYKEQSVGSILSAELFRLAIDEDRVSEIDYGIGSEAYKRDWMTSVRRIVGIVGYNRRTLRGIGSIAARFVVALTRRFSRT